MFPIENALQILLLMEKSNNLRIPLSIILNLRCAIIEITVRLHYAIFLLAFLGRNEC
jgi:hypothetical protein